MNALLGGHATIGNSKGSRPPAESPLACRLRAPRGLRGVCQRKLESSKHGNCKEGGT